MHCSTSFLAGAYPKTAFAKGGLLDELKKALAERALNTELDQHHAGSEGNSRNGYGGMQRRAGDPITGI